MLPFGQLRPLGGGSPVVKVGTNRPWAQVLVVAHPEPCDECAAYLQSFEEVAEALRNEKGDVLALVGPDWDEGAIPPSAKAVIGEGKILERLSPDHTPVVAVVDRYGQLFLRADAGNGHQFPHHDRILGTLLDIGIRCPECGVPDVPPPDYMPEEGTFSGGMYLGQ